MTRGVVMMAAVMMVAAPALAQPVRPGNTQGAMGQSGGSGQQLDQPSANQNQPQMQTNQSQQPPEAHAEPPTADAQTKPNKLPELSK